MELMWGALDVLMSLTPAKVDLVLFRQVSREARWLADAHVVRLSPEPWEQDATAARVLRRFVALTHLDIANSPVRRIPGRQFCARKTMDHRELQCR